MSVNILLDPDLVQHLVEEAKFISSLSSPYCLHQLAMEGYLVNTEFLDYLNHLHNRWAHYLPQLHNVTNSLANNELNSTTDAIASIYNALTHPVGLHYLEMLIHDANFRYKALELGFILELTNIQYTDTQV